jgi:hypothetical protein
MMMKQGWQAGKGLGATESGVTAPIRPADPREKSGMYKGIGVSKPDEFENFRNAKSRKMTEGYGKRR